MTWPAEPAPDGREPGERPPGYVPGRQEIQRWSRDPAGGEPRRGSLTLGLEDELPEQWDIQSAPDLFKADRCTLFVGEVPGHSDYRRTSSVGFSRWPSNQAIPTEPSLEYQVWRDASHSAQPIPVLTSAPDGSVMLNAGPVTPVEAVPGGTCGNEIENVAP